MVVPGKKPARQRPVSDTRARVLKLRERHPEMTATEIALKVDRSVGIVRRYLAETRPVQAAEPATDDAVVEPDQHAELAPSAVRRPGAAIPGPGLTGTHKREGTTMTTIDETTKNGRAAPANHAAVQA